MTIRIVKTTKVKAMWSLLLWCEQRHWAYMKKREITFLKCFYPYAFLHHEIKQNGRILYSFSNILCLSGWDTMKLSHCKTLGTSTYETIKAFLSFPSLNIIILFFICYLIYLYLYIYFLLKLYLCHLIYF